MKTPEYRITQLYSSEVKNAGIKVTIADEDCNAIIIARQDTLRRIEVIKNSRSFQLNVLYITLKSGDPIDSIMQAIAILDKILDKAKSSQRKLYPTLIQAYADTVDAGSFSQNPGNIS
jgi:hypothetical protein